VTEGGGDILAPNAERKDGSGGTVRRELPYLAIALGLLVLAVVVVVVLRLIVGSNASSVTEAIEKLLGPAK
jgi:type VI secretion system protein ImpK